jgi:hypothetical protein
MIDLRRIIPTIEKLLAEETPQSITYAALECRLAIEKVCYERLKVVHDYIAHEDLRGWCVKSARRPHVQSRSLRHALGKAEAEAGRMALPASASQNVAEGKPAKWKITTG